MLFAVWWPMAQAGGGASLAEDRCVVNMGFQSAHLFIYQPQARGGEAFCSTLPEATNTVFVLDYLHESLNRSPIELRIIEDVTGQGRFARWSDIEAIPDLDSVTVFREPPVTRPGGSWKTEHAFEREGEYLLLVTSRHPSKDIVYHAISPLTVGATPWWYWLALPLVGGIAVLGWLVYRRRAVDSRRGSGHE